MDVVWQGDSFPFSPHTTRSEAEALWYAPQAAVYVMEQDGEVRGSFYLKPNQPALGDHVANGGFMVSKAARGRGVGRAMGLLALEEARRLGYTAMQFNFVVSSNETAVALWRDLGFSVVGLIPDAFRHLSLGPTDVLIMYRRL